MIKKLVSLVIILCLMMLMAPSVSAQSSLTVTESVVEVNFPWSVTFYVSAVSNNPITEIRLRYSVKQLGFADVSAEALLSFTPSTTVDAEWNWDMRYIGGLPPGTVINYWWICKDNSGAVVQTAREHLTFDDSRFSWQTITADMITLYWYEGSESFAQEILTTAQDAITRLAADTGAYMKEPIRLYIYASSNDLLGSMIYPQEWAGGVTFTRYSCIAIGISTLNLSWGESAIAHELTHLVTHQMTLNPYNTIPVWLDEGLAMYNEGPMQLAFTAALNNAIKNKSLLSVQTLASPFSALTDISYLSYAESYSIVDYLIRTYGKDKMFQLLDTFHQGSTYDGALRKVYGFDTTGLNAAWQKALGIPQKTY
ncbi:MAG TPA: peptidase MA family metallohydrolase [Dehalococcoidales bacterium]